MIHKHYHLPSLVDLASLFAAALLLALSASGLADAMLLVAMLLAFVGVTMLPGRVGESAMIFAAVGCAVAAAVALVHLLP